MKEHAILFSTPMIRAILDGRKSQTRRIIKFPDAFDKQRVYDNYPFGLKYGHKDGTVWRLFPKWEVGDILWGRETFFETNYGSFIYKANANKDIGDGFKWKPSIFMPKEACRIRLEITNIRFERVQDISEEDAIAEGIEMNNKPHKGWYWMENVYSTDSAVLAYEHLWNKINGKKYPWSSNPWVWVIEFEKL